MPITQQDVEQALAAEPEELPGRYDDRDTLLYAVAIGMGRDPLDPKELEYVCETVGQRVVPTAATVLSRPTRPGSGSGFSLLGKMNFAMMLHGEQRLTVHQPLPPAAETLISNRTTGVYDKGEGKGTLVTNETTVKLADGSPLYTVGSTLFFRADGGFGGSSEGAPVPHPLPERAPDAVCEMPERQDQALIYALCGDRNPLATATRCIAIPSSRARPASMRPSCTACAPTASPVTPCSKPCSTTTRRESKASTCASHRRCIPARPRSWRCGRTAT
jgi:hypothetical protein